jgi:hypothetical protein
MHIWNPVQKISEAQYSEIYKQFNFSWVHSFVESVFYLHKEFKT